MLHCNGELMGVRKNMIYQFKNVGRIWFADLERVNGSYVIEVAILLLLYVAQERLLLFLLSSKHNSFCVTLLHSRSGLR